MAGEGLVGIAALAASAAVAAGDQATRAALDAVWLDGPPGPVVRVAPHAVRIGATELAAAAAWCRTASARAVAAGLGPLRAAVVGGEVTLWRDPVTQRPDLQGDAVRAAITLLARTPTGQVLLDEESAAAVGAAAESVDGGFRLRAAAEPLPGALPALTDPFVGRVSELTTALGLLRDHAPVALVGPGGAGKTRLAVEVALRWAAGGRRAAFVALESARDADDVLLAVARAVGADLSVGGVDTLARVLASHGDVLLVVDNVEPVAVEVEALFGALTGRTPELHLLFTSRVPVSGATSLPVGGLSVADALALFQGACPQPDRFGPSDDAEIAALVAAVDCLPLAVRLAASRSDVLRPAQVHERLRLLFGASSHRHGSLAVSLEASLGLLSPDGRAAASALAVFWGTFALEDAEALLGADAWSALDALRAASLLRVSGEPPRFALYEQVRFHLRSTAPPSGAVRARHAAWAIRGVPEWFEGRAPTAGRLARLQRERADLRVVLEEGSPAQQAWAAAALEQDESAGVPGDTRLRTLDRGVEAADRDGDPRLRALLRLLRGLARHFVGRPGADADLDAAEAVAAPDDDAVRARLARSRLRRRLAAGDLAGAHVQLTALRACATGRPLFEGAAFDAEARLALLARDLPRADGLSGAAARRFEDAGDVVSLGYALLERAIARRLLAPVDGLADVDRAAALFAREGHLPGSDLADVRRLGFQLAQGDDTGAVQTATRHAQRSRAFGEAVREAGALTQLASVHLFFGRPTVAEAVLAAAEPQFDGVPTIISETATLMRVAARVDVDDPVGARAWLARPTTHPALRCNAALWEGVLCALAGDLAGAAAHLAGVTPDPLGSDVFLAAEREGFGVAEFDDLAARAPTVDRCDVNRVVLLRVARRRAELRHRRTLRIAPDGGSLTLPDGAEMDLSRRAPLRRIVTALADAHPSGPLSLDALVAAGWPGERVVWTAATNRVYVAVATLRKLGLEGLLTTGEDGYRLEPSLRVLRS